MNKERLTTYIKNYIKQEFIKKVDLRKLEIEKELFSFIENLFYLELGISDEEQDYYMTTVNEIMELDIEADVEFRFSLDKDSIFKEDIKIKTIKNIPMKVKNLLYSYDSFWVPAYEYLEKVLDEEGIKYNEIYDQGDSDLIDIRFVLGKEGKQ